MPDSQTLTLADGRNIGFIRYGPSDGTPVVYCHGAPGCRIIPEPFIDDIAANDFRMIGIDRPGYGLSTPNPGHTIADWVPDCLALMDALDISRFVAAGISTGGAYLWRSLLSLQNVSSGLLPVARQRICVGRRARL